MDATAQTPTPHTGDGGRRRSGASRREDIMRAFSTLVTDRGLDAVSMEAVADRAGISRALLYKHFTSRDGLITAVYRREVDDGHHEILAAMRAARTIEGMYEALARGSLRAGRQRYPLFVALFAAAQRSQEVRHEVYTRADQICQLLVERTSRELRVPTERARLASDILISAISTIMREWYGNPTDSTATRLIDTYMTLVRGGLAGLAATQPAAATAPATAPADPYVGMS
ncbi:TetR/AcrR family transcriptional regulator [Parafrankia sp. FMc2]|uniref:TetR/AcrR family transcriptional regulator n=1 Tax=Parafrankia sp. FMc2 TaxID=3233196 RepID=UPI0034D54731